MSPKEAQVRQRLRWIQPVCESDADVAIGDEATMDGLRLVVADWSLSLTEDERDEYPSPMLWWAEEMGL